MSIWNNLNSLNENQLAILVRSVVEIISLYNPNAVESNLPTSFANLTPEILEGLNIKESINIEDLNISFQDIENQKGLTLSILNQLRLNEPLASIIEEKYKKNSQLMSLETILLSAGLVILMIKVKDLTIGDDGLRITFRSEKEIIKNFILNFKNFSNKEVE